MATLKWNVARGWQNEEAPAKGSVCYFHDAMMVYRSQAIQEQLNNRVQNHSSHLLVVLRLETYLTPASPDELHVKCIRLAY